MGLPQTKTNNINTQNQIATANFVKIKYPHEKFVSDVSQIKNQNKYTKGLIIPKGVKVAESRMPNSAEQRRNLRKELRQAYILAKKGKGNDTNVFISIESNISKHEAQRRIGMVLERHPEYTGKIIVSFNALTTEEKIYFWDTTDLR